MFDKKVAFVITSQHCIPHGGIGQFCKSFVDMAEELNWAVNIIMDKPATKSSLTDYLDNKNNVAFYNVDRSSYAGHNKRFVFEDTMNLERMVNIRDNFFDALESNIYDFVIINSPDGVTPVYNLGLSKYIPVIFYTHSENFIFLEHGANKVFSETCINYMQNLLRLPSLTIGTQTETNVKEIKNNFGLKSLSLPMRVPELSLLEEKKTEKSGILFTGRWEPRKNPQAFCDAIIELGLPAKVLTNAKGKEKFEKYFKDAGHTDYDIRASIIGKEKIEFIQSAKLAYHPAKLESFGFSAFESLHCCPTYCLEEYNWHKNFEGLVIPLNKKEITKRLNEDYFKEDLCYNKRLEKLNFIDLETKRIWKELSELPKTGISNKENSLSKSLEDESILVMDYYYDILKRKDVAIDDVGTVYKKLDDIELYHEVENTYVNKKGTAFNPAVKKSESLEGLFE